MAGGGEGLPSGMWLRGGGDLFLTLAWSSGGSWGAGGGSQDVPSGEEASRIVGTSAPASTPTARHPPSTDPVCRARAEWASSGVWGRRSGPLTCGRWPPVDVGGSCGPYLEQLRKKRRPRGARPARATVRVAVSGDLAGAPSEGTVGARTLRSVLGEKEVLVEAQVGLSRCQL